MIASCPDCDHGLWSEVRSGGSLRFLVHFDDDEGSATYAEHVRCCPGCGAGLGGRAAGRRDGERRVSPADARSTPVPFRESPLI